MRGTWRACDAPAGQRRTKAAGAKTGNEKTGRAVGARGQRQTPEQRCGEGVALPESGGERAGLDAFFQRPGEIALAPDPDHQEACGVNPERGEPRPVGHAEFMRGPFSKDPEKRRGFRSCPLPPPQQRQSETECRPAVAIGMGTHLMQPGRVEAATRQDMVDLLRAEGPGRGAGLFLCGSVAGRVVRALCLGHGGSGKRHGSLLDYANFLTQTPDQAGTRGYPACCPDTRTTNFTRY